MPDFAHITRAILGLNEKAVKNPPVPGGGTFSGDWLSVKRNEIEGVTYSSDRLDSTSIIAAVLGWITRTFPEAPLVIKQRQSTGDFEIIPEHPLAELIDMPNKFYSGVVLWMSSVADWWVDGNAYWLKGRDAQFGVNSLWWVPHWMIEPKGSDDSSKETTEDNFIAYYDYKPGAGQRYKLDPKDVVHFRHGIDPQNMRKGRSRFKALFREIFTDEEAALFTAALLHNMGVPGLVVSPAKETTEYTPSTAEVDATKAYIKQSFSGSNRGEALVFKGPMSVQQFGFSPEQLNLRELRRIPEERISGVVGIAAIVAGLGAGLDRSTFANYAEAREASYEENIIPTQRILAADIKSQLLVDFEPDPQQFRVAFDTSEVRILQEDKNAESDRFIAQWRGGVAMLSEVRSRLGYDVEKEHDVYALPLNADFVLKEDLAEYLAPAPPPEPSQPPAPLLLPPGAPAQERLAGPSGGETQGEGTGTPSGPNARARRALARSKAGSASGRQARFLRGVERAVQPIADRFAHNLDDDYVALGAVARLAALDVLKEEGKATESSSVDADLAAIMGSKRVTNATTRLEKEWAAEFPQHYAAVGEAVFAETAAYLDLDMVWNETDPRELAVIRAGGKRAGLIDIKQGLSSEVRAGLEAGRKAGEGPRQIARRISDEVGSSFKAVQIARTETKYAQNVSSIEAYKKSEVVTGLRAFDNQTGYDDADCSERDGKVYSFDEAETLTAEEHPNGTLSWAPVTGR